MFEFEIRIKGWVYLGIRKELINLKFLLSFWAIFLYLNLKKNSKLYFLQSTCN